MRIEQVHETALLLNRLAHLYHSVSRKVHPDDEALDNVAEQMNALYEGLPDQPIAEEQ